MPRMAREVGRTPEDVEHASVDPGIAQLTERGVHGQGIPAREILDLLEAEVAKVLSYAGPDTGNRLQLSRWQG